MYSNSLVWILVNNNHFDIIAYILKNKSNMERRKGSFPNIIQSDQRFKKNTLTRKFLTKNGSLRRLQTKILKILI